MTAQPRQMMSEQDVQARLARAVDLHKRQDYAGAIAIYREVARLESRSFRRAVADASALRLSGRLDQALQIFDDLAEMQPQRPEFWFNRGNALTDANRLDEAIVLLSQVRRSGPGFRADALQPRHRFGQERRARRRRRGLSPDAGLEPAHKGGHAQSRNLLVDTGRSHEGIALLRQAIARWPKRRRVTTISASR